MKTRDSGRLTACVFFVFLFFVLKQIVVEKPVALFLYLCQRDASVLLLLQTQGFLRLFLFSQALVDEHGHLHRVVLEGANERLVQARRRLLPFRFLQAESKRVRARLPTACPGKQSLFRGKLSSNESPYRT